MKNSERIIKQTAKENFNLFKEEWAKGKYDLPGFDAVEELAEVYFQERNDLEIERDKLEQVTEADYKKWVKEAFDEWYYNFVEEQAMIGEDGADGNGLSVEDILAKGSKQKIAKYLGWY